MSLDVYLRLPDGGSYVKDDAIFIRENGAKRQISRAEWDERYPNREPVMVMGGDESDEVYSANITHNLGQMAAQAGLYALLWRPDENGITRAAQLIGPLTAGLELLRSDPGKFAIHNPENGWGTYEGLVRFVEDYLAACIANPNAKVEVSR